MMKTPLPPPQRRPPPKKILLPPPNPPPSLGSQRPEVGPPGAAALCPMLGSVHGATGGLPNQQHQQRQGQQAQGGGHLGGAIGVSVGSVWGQWDNREQ